MTSRNLMSLAALGSLAVLLGAFVFQALGYAPCQLCLWQRWPHAIAIALGGLVLLIGPLVLLGLAGALLMLVSATLGVYHTGVERGFWEGPATCSGNAGALDGLSGSDLLSMDVVVNIIRCDEVAWADPVLGLSMATWNVFASLAFAGLWVWGMRARA